MKHLELKMVIAKIQDAPKTDNKFFVTTKKNTDIAQRETLEQVIVNLSTILGAKTIYKKQSARGGTYYEVQAPGFGAYQSASNTILELSRKLLTEEKQ